MDTKRETSAQKQILTALIATIPTFTYGIQIGWLSPTRAILEAGSPSQAPLTPADVSWLAAALPLAAIAGIPAFSYGSDRFGRKICGIVVSLLSCVSWIIKLTYVTSGALIAARVLAGLAAAGCFVVVPAYIKEVAEDAWRGALGSLNMTMFKLGVIFVYAVGMSPSYRVQQGVFLAVSLAHVALSTLLPESPNFLLKVGREKRAIKVLSWLRSVDEDHESVRDEICRLKEEQKRVIDTPRVTLRSVVNDRATFSALRMVLVLMGIQTLSGCFALMNYAAEIFARAGVAWSPNTLALFVGALQLVGAGFTTASIEKFGRKIPLTCSILAVGACMCALGTCFLISGGVVGVKGADGGAVGAEGADGGVVGALAAAAVCACMLTYGAGLAPVPMVYMAEVFTFQVRARMAGVSMAFSFFCSSLTVLFYTPVADHFGPYVVFYTFSAVCLLGLVYTVLWVPETKGKSLDEIRSYWKKDEPTFV